MSKYGWNLEDLKEKTTKSLKEAEENIDVIGRERYFKLFQEYQRLVEIVLMHNGEIDFERITSDEWLSIIKSQEALDDYDNYTKMIRKKILGSFSDFRPLPYTHFSKTFDQDESVKLLRDIIHEIFGDKNSKVYEDRILNSPHMLQFAKSDSDTLTSMFVREDGLDIYASVPDIKNLNFISNLAHESGHIYRFVTNEYEVYPDNKLLEFESFSYEIRVLDFMIRNNIHRKEAIKAMIKLINKIETIIYVLKNKDIVRAKNMQHLTHLAYDRDLYRYAHLPNNFELLNYLEYVRGEYVFPYIYSALAVFDTLESDPDLSKYRSVVENIGKVDEDEITSKIIEDPESFNNLANYRKYREKILGLYYNK